MPVLFVDDDLELELLVEWTAGLLSSALFTEGVDSYFLTGMSFFTYGFLNSVPVEVALASPTFSFFLDSGFSMLFI